jgi:hypothetical protein
MKLSQQAQSLKLGKYQQYKGGYYEVFGVALHSETLEEMVVYQSLKSDDLWVRPLKMFIEEVSVDGEKKKRFKFVG